MAEATADVRRDSDLLTVPVYRLENVARIYAATPPVPALRDCDLTIRPGDYVSIVGTSGSGKSTLLNLLGLIDAPTSGRLIVAGTEVSDLSDSARTELRGRLIGFIFQSFHLLPARTAMDNVCLPMIYQRVPRSSRLSRAAAALERVGLGSRKWALPSTLSGGEAQRVAIARAVVGAPRVLLCDEPTGNLDERNSEQVVALLEELNSDGLTVVVVTHDTAIAGRARRMIRVSDGIVTGGS
jgi:putative ABC transport system ATP-binding protein